jgi:predicted transcriptional regulator
MKQLTSRTRDRSSGRPVMTAIEVAGRILRVLTEGPRTRTELTRATGLFYSQLQHGMRILKDRQWIETRESRYSDGVMARGRQAEVWTITESGKAALASWPS